MRTEQVSSARLQFNAKFLTGMDFLLYMASLKGLTKSEAKRKAQKQIGGLSGVAKRKLQPTPEGMKQTVLLSTFE